MSWNDIAQWSPSEVGRLAQRVTEAARAFDAGADVLTAAAADLDWQGAAADAAREAACIVAGWAAACGAAATTWAARCGAPIRPIIGGSRAPTKGAG